MVRGRHVRKELDNSLVLARLRMEIAAFVGPPRAVAIAHITASIVPRVLRDFAAKLLVFLLLRVEALNAAEAEASAGGHLSDVGVVMMRSRVKWRCE